MAQLEQIAEKHQEEAAEVEEKQLELASTSLNLIRAPSMSRSNMSHLGAFSFVDIRTSVQRSVVCSGGDVAHPTGSGIEAVYIVEMTEFRIAHV